MTLPTTETTRSTDDEIIDSISTSYDFGWHDSDEAGEKAKRGLDEQVVREISAIKGEPEWMLAKRLKAYSTFERKPMPTWGVDLSQLDMDAVKYYVRSTDRPANSWDDLPEDIKNTYDRIGIPEAERERLVTSHLGQVVQGTVGQVGVALREGGAGLGRQDVVPGRATAAALARLGRRVHLDLLSVLKGGDVPAHGGRRQPQDLGELRRRHRSLLSDEVENACPGRVVVTLSHDGSPPLVASDASRPAPLRPVRPCPGPAPGTDLRGVAGRCATSLTKILLAEFNTGKFTTERRRVGLNTSSNQR